MNANRYTEKKEGGNAITLTLLGLSVAILAGVLVLYVVGKSTPKPVNMPDLADEDVVDDAEKIKNPREGWGVYQNEEYDFSLEYPPGWVVATGTLTTGDPVISLYRATGTSTDMVFDHQEVASHVSVYPLGIATEGIQGAMKASSVIVEVPRASAKDYILFETERPWATIATFEEYPETWNSSGFVFARLVIEEEEIMYMRGDNEIAQHEFDPFSGDHIERTGFIDTQERVLQEEILKSFRFLGDAGESEVDSGNPKILVNTPLASSTVLSPLTVQGAMLGKWIFDEEYSVRIQTSNGEVITEAPIIFEENPEEEEKSTFEVSLVFDVPAHATSGTLIVETKRGALDAHTSIPVLFEVEETEPVGI